MGAGGNLIANLISLDTAFNFYDDSEFDKDCWNAAARYEFLKAYYLQPVTSETWLNREWSIRTKHVNRFYANHAICYWDPFARSVYLLHGGSDEINSVLFDQNLLRWDRSGVDSGRLTEQASPWTLQECTHIFILANDIDHVTDVYASKNYSLNQFDQNNTQKHRHDQAYTHNRDMHNRLLTTKDFLLKKNRRVLTYCAEDLFKNSGEEVILDIIAQLDIAVDLKYVTEIYSIWLQSSRDLYYNHYNRELK
jgi:hypothetical protein